MIWLDHLLSMYVIRKNVLQFKAYIYNLYFGCDTWFHFNEVLSFILYTQVIQYQFKIED